MSAAPPPPPPGFPSAHPVPDQVVIPPPPVAEVPLPPVEESKEAHENDVLKRSAKFSWKNFGGDGFMVSVAVHVLLAIIGIFYVVSKYVEPSARKTDEVFATGAGGGSNGDKAKAFEHKLKTRSMQVKTPSRIVSKSSTASVSLPSAPVTSTASFATGLSSGGMSKGAGGGSGGGEGTGIGIGKGGGRNFVSLFGAKGVNAAGLPGTFYDCKQLPSGASSAYADDASNHAYIDKVLRPFIRNWDTTLLDKFFKSPETLTAGQMFISSCSADDAPKYYEVADKCKGKRWIAHYKGSVIAPKTGKFRFVVMGDDSMVVRFNGKVVADGGYVVLGFPGYLCNFGGKPDPKRATPPGLTEDVYKGAAPPPFRCGNWIDVIKGREYPLELLISEIPGGLFGAWCMMEESDSAAPTKGDGKLFLFRMNADDLPEGIKQDTGLEVDMSGKGLIWKARGAKKTVR